MEPPRPHPPRIPRIEDIIEKMTGSNLPKLQDAMNLRDTDTSNITHYQIQSALELRLDSFDGDPRTVHCSVSSLPNPVRNSFYSDPGNILLAENIRSNSKYLTKLLSCRIKSAPTGLLHPIGGLRKKPGQGAPHHRPSTKQHRASTVNNTYPHSSSPPHRDNKRKTDKIPDSRVMFVRTQDQLLHLVNGTTKRGQSAPWSLRVGSVDQTPAKQSGYRRRAASCNITRQSRDRHVTNQDKHGTDRVANTPRAKVKSGSSGSSGGSNGLSLNSRREQTASWCRKRTDSKGSQGLALANICRPLPISYNSFLVKSVSSSST